MDTLSFHRFFDWVNSGAAAASLAFFGLLLSSDAGKSGAAGLIATGLFFFAMFALVAASAIGKLISDYASSNDVAPKPVNKVHAYTTTTGLLAFTVGLTLLAMAVSKWLAVPLLAGLIVLLGSFKRVHNGLVT
ncbi:hypothetical protein [Marinobacter sp. UBA3607]|jgi:hypothetical protein|uniref:hypothetical protein n=1 Tax=Marinobacter sp. UBA3607 TaxID=1946820 RepID=UPI00257F4AAC|nr:hypothetical protein [Marinobacter sp. UBA3607]|tara:strand:- start:10738 stop:11136 length:399 start_codon:yes stop_codon:yes gene_type:complete